MNKLELKIEQFTPPGDKQSINLVGIYIDGKNLADSVHEFEKRKKFDEYLESYIGRYPQSFLYDVKSDNGREIEILVSPFSLMEGDWDITMNYDIKDGKVIWYGFHQPRRNDPGALGGYFWDYSDFPAFTFDEKQYRQELAKIVDYVANREKDNLN